mgnify:CR=1 FL=1
MRTQDIEKTDANIISSIYYNYDANMAKAFNGTRLPKDYPKDTEGVRYLQLNGKAMCFSELEAYCTSKGIITKEE